MKDRRTDILIVSSLFIIFGLLYFKIANDFRSLPGYSIYNNLLFGADHVEALNGWVAKHKGIHPLILLFVVPASWILSNICATYELAVVVLSALVGGFTVSAFYLLCRMIISRWQALPITIFWALSMNQIFLATIPDSYELVALSIFPTIALTIFCLKNKQLYLFAWIFVGLLSFSITITSVVQTVICLCVVLYSLKPIKEWTKPILGFSLGLISIAAILNLIQYKLFPGSQLFWSTSVYQHEMDYVYPLILSNPWQVIKELVKSFILFNFIGVEPVILRFKSEFQLKLIYFQGPVKYSILGIGALLFWLGLYFRGIFFTLLDHKSRLLVISLWLGILFNLIMHSFYSTDELYLYTPHFTFIVLLTCISAASFQAKWTVFAWWIAALLTGCNNLIIQQDLIKKYGSARPVNIISENSEWKYWKGKERPGKNWKKVNFDDKKWEIGKNGFGYGDDDDSTILKDMKGNYSTLYIRKEFNVTSESLYNNLLVDVDYDDGIVIYLNGKSVFRRNAGKKIKNFSRAIKSHEAGRPRRYRLSNDSLVVGKNILAVVGLNNSIKSSDFTLKVKLWKVESGEEATALSESK